MEDLGEGLESVDYTCQKESKAVQEDAPASNGGDSMTYAAETAARAAGAEGGLPTLRTVCGGGGAGNPAMVPVGAGTGAGGGGGVIGGGGHTQDTGGLAGALLEAGRRRGPQAEAQARRLSSQWAQLQERAQTDVDAQWWEELVRTREEINMMLASKGDNFECKQNSAAHRARGTQ